MKLVLHHWDADGIASAVIYTQVKAENFDYFTPEIGNYFLDENDRTYLRSLGHEEAVLLDMSLPENDLRFLNSLSSFMVIDHHHGKKIEGVKIHNPVIEGRGEYPANTRVLKELYSLSHSALEYVGIYGDTGFKLKEDDPLLQEMKAFFGERFEEFKRAVKIIDLQYKTGNRERVYEMVRFLLGNSVFSVLDRREFTEVESLVEDEKLREFKRLRELDGLNFIFTPSRFRIVSDLARKLYAMYPEKLNVVIGLQGNYLNFYLRTGVVDLSPLVKRARELGYYAGGKREVIGAVLPRERLEEYRELLEKFFRENGITLNLNEALEEVLN